MAGANRVGKRLLRWWETGAARGIARLRIPHTVRRTKKAVGLAPDRFGSFEFR
jgi:hypothetical protein